MKPIFFIFGIACPVSALAYLDPGTGSIMLQGLIALLAAAAVVIRTYWYKIKSLFVKTETKNFLEDESEDSDPDLNP
jgi:hypothetical protein